MSPGWRLYWSFSPFSLLISRLDCDSGSGVLCPGPTVHCFHAGTIVPDTHSVPLSNLVLPQSKQEL